MRTVKEGIIEFVRSLPDDSTAEDILHRLAIRSRVESAIAEIDEGLIVSQEEAERRGEEWLKSPGPDRR